MHQLLKAGIDRNEIDYVFLTHFHPDHSSELGSFIQSLNWTSDCIRRKDLILIGPAGFKAFCKKTIKVRSGTGSYQLKIYEIRKNMDFDEFKVVCMKTIHNPESIAYKFTKKQNQL